MKRCSARSETAQITVSRVATHLISELIDECQNLDCLWDEATVTTYIRTASSERISINQQVMAHGRKRPNSSGKTALIESLLNEAAWEPAASESRALMAKR
jgi:hypothetical protein